MKRGQERGEESRRLEHCHQLLFLSLLSGTLQPIYTRKVVPIVEVSG